MFHGHQHVLDHVMLLVETSDGFSLRELQQRDLGRNHPAEEPAEYGVVAEWNNILQKSYLLVNICKQTAINLTHHSFYSSEIYFTLLIFATFQLDCLSCFYFYVTFNN